jgi:DNA-binding response OmpR family regulator
MATTAPKKVLIIEDEKEILELVKLYIERGGYRVVTATNGTEGLKAVKTERPDLIILDLMLPEVDGLEVCKRIRNAPETATLPIIMLTAKAEESDTVIGLELGADDYVPKPFSPKALVSRVKALLRRVDQSREEGPVRLVYGELTVDVGKHEAAVGGREVTLTAKEFGLLEHFLRNPGRVLTRDVLLNAVWGYDYFGTTRTVDVHIRRLKQKMPLLNGAIVSVKSLGYKLKSVESVD